MTKFIEIIDRKRVHLIITVFLVSFVGVFGENYNIKKNPKLLKLNIILFFILGVIGFFLGMLSLIADLKDFKKSLNENS